MPLVALLLLSLAFPTAALSQSIAVGVTAGPVQARQAGRSDHQWKPQPGVVAGLTASADLTRVISLQLEALYSQKGFRVDLYNWMQQSYLEIPVLARFVVPTAGAWRPLLSIGVAPAVELSCRGSRSTEPGIGPAAPAAPRESAPLDCDGQRNFLGDLGLIGAVGTEVRGARTIWSAELRYTHGRSNLYRSSGVIPPVTNRAIVLLVGARLRVR